MQANSVVQAILILHACSDYLNKIIGPYQPCTTYCIIYKNRRVPGIRITRVYIFNKYIVKKYLQPSVAQEYFVAYGECFMSSGGW